MRRKKTEPIRTRPSSLLDSLHAVLLSVVNETGPTIPKQKLSAIGLGLGEERQQNVAHFGRYSFFLQDFERLRQVQHLRNRRRFFQAPTAQCLPQASHAAPKLCTLVGSPQLENLCLSLP